MFAVTCTAAWSATPSYRLRQETWRFRSWVDQRRSTRSGPGPRVESGLRVRITQHLSRERVADARISDSRYLAAAARELRGELKKETGWLGRTGARRLARLARPAPAGRQELRELKRRKEIARQLFRE